MITSPAQVKQAFLKSLGRQIRRARRDADLTQDSLAKRIGVRRAQIGRMEKGAVDMPASKLVALALALHKPLNYFMEPYQRETTDVLTDEERLELEDTLRHLLGKPE
ncbi:helix-turn-helix transcriptional regulator [Oceanicaulis alexandrii]|uniref:helix-turn-helix domain-containing protein n=1 Tax=Oceanicaulis alexandrii TaxID=153233 RepID=UPI0035CFFB87